MELEATVYSNKVCDIELKLKQYLCIPPVYEGQASGKRVGDVTGRQI